MRAWLRRRGTAVGLALLVGGCSAGDGPTDPGGDGYRMTATIDGQAWRASSLAGGFTAMQFAPASGGYLMIGVDISPLGALNSSIAFSINNISGPGTYPLGVDAATVYGGYASYTGANGMAWTTPFSGAAGSITISTLTTTRIAGTFSFTATPLSGGATGTKTVTNGVFDLPITGDAVMPLLTDSMGRKMSASLNGQPWNAATISAGTSQTHFSLTGINDFQTLVLTLPKPTALGTYPLGNASSSILMAWDPSSVAPQGARCCWGIAGDAGSITFTHLTTTRARGTFTATMRPQPGTAATGQLSITNGSFDVGLYHP